jgi:hypothetical protein
MRDFVKRQWLFVFVLIAVVGFSCNDDDGPANRATAGDESWSFSNAYIITRTNVTDDDGETGSLHEVYLVSNGLTLVSSTQIEGEGDLAGFQLFSPSSTELEEGTYELINTKLPGHVPVFVMAKGYSWDNVNPDYDLMYMGSYGTVKVSKAGETYTFDFNLSSYEVNDGGGFEAGTGEIKGYYRGKLVEIEPAAPARTEQSLFGLL